MTVLIHLIKNIQTCKRKSSSGNMAIIYEPFSLSGFLHSCCGLQQNKNMDFYEDSRYQRTAADSNGTGLIIEIILQTKSLKKTIKGMYRTTPVEREDNNQALNKTYLSYVHQNKYTLIKSIYQIKI